MADFGRTGGRPERRLVNSEDEFEMAVVRCLGQKIRQDIDVAEALWAALSNVEWENQSGDSASYSFRAAGDMIAAIRDDGNYMDWYCCRRSGEVDPIISDAMATEGWSVARTF